MKISALPKITKVRRDIEIPLAVAGENRSITLGQIIDAVPKGIVPFSEIRHDNNNVQYVNGTSTAGIGHVIYDTVTDEFYLARSTTNNVAGQNVTAWTYWSDWDTRDTYYDSEGFIRDDCLFCLPDGRLYFYDGNSLVSAGITEEQAKQIRHSTPIEVASEEEMANRIALGEYEEGQLYFLAESE